MPVPHPLRPATTLPTFHAMTSKPTITWTLTDEAPMLATYSLLPFVRMFAANAGIHVDVKDISLSCRILAAFPERL